MKSIAGLLKRLWVVVVVVIALAAALAVVGRLRTFFDSDQPYAAASEHVDAIVPFNTKRVTYEIIGPGTTTGRVSYLDDKGKTQEATFATLPWSVSVTTTDPGILANVVAQGDSESLGCRILVNDRVVAEHYAEGRDAQAFCLDKAA
ncbi:MmpS family transport accessory protein [Mycobacterium antarcticum]|uniref:MmpS family transport accessory protein n=1 Tax=Mycolicibacterium sp. TUM20984 TaxID=3023368 RepID=UPI00238E394C|nr:MmpS family transport accessory protein [Mycolicibacterium sp. TUM20984]GLP82814.1 putative membrane protein, MmpS [Mycolicibacterium sp. TUM20984]